MGNRTAAKLHEIAEEILLSRPLSRPLSIPRIRNPGGVIELNRLQIPQTAEYRPGVHEQYIMAEFLGSDDPNMRSMTVQEVELEHHMREMGNRTAQHLEDLLTQVLHASLLPSDEDK